jgi:hypothetical protein
MVTDFGKTLVKRCLAIEKVDIRSKQNGIWALKPRLLEGVNEPWLNVFSRTRHGWDGCVSQKHLEALSAFSGLKAGAVRNSDNNPTRPIEG